jgi:hypothetical protein
MIGNRKQYTLAYSFPNNKINAKTTKLGTIEHVFSQLVFVRWESVFME